MASETRAGRLASEVFRKVFGPKPKTRRSRTNLKNTYMHYVAAYGLSLSTVIRNKRHMDDPIALRTKLTFAPGRKANLKVLNRFIHDHKLKLKRRR